MTWLHCKEDSQKILDCDWSATVTFSKKNGEQSREWPHAIILATEQQSYQQHEYSKDLNDAYIQILVRKYLQHEGNRANY
jgi:hypothetical protein